MSETPVQESSLTSVAAERRLAGGVAVAVAAVAVWRAVAGGGIAAVAAGWAVAVLALALAVRSWRPDGRGRRVTTAVAGAVAAGAGVAALVPESAAWFVSGPAEVAGWRVTAALLAVVAALQAGLLALRVRRWALAGAVGLMLGAGFVALSGLAGLPQVDERVLPWSAAALLAGLGGAAALHAGLRRETTVLLGAEAGDGGPGAGPPLSPRTWWIWAALVAVVLPGVAFLSVREHLDRVRDQVQAELAAVAGLQETRLLAWRAERLADVRTLARSPTIVAAGALPAGSAERAAMRRTLEEYLDALRTAYGYESVVVFDRARQVLATAPAGLAASPPSAEVETELRAGTPAFFRDLYRTPEGAVRLEVWAPLPAGADGTPAGAVTLMVDGRAELKRLIGGWPVPTRTGESVLLRVRGDRIELLTDLRGQPEAALTLGRSRDEAGWLASEGLRRGTGGLVEGHDIFGASAMGVVRKVEGTPWVLVAKIGRDEVLERERSEVATTAVLAALLALGLTFGVRTAYRKRVDTIRAERRAAEEKQRAADERLGLILKHANDVVMLLDGLRVVETNDRCEALYGWTPAEMTTLTLDRLRAPETQGTLESDHAAIADTGTVFETRHRRRDGTVFPVEVSARRVRLEGRPMVFALVRDITQRKEHEREIERLGRSYRVLSEVNHAISHLRARDELLRTVVRVLVETGCYRVAWIGWQDAAEGGAWATPAQAGRSDGLVEALHAELGGAAADRADAGPAAGDTCGGVWRAGSICVCNDIAKDAAAARWRGAAARSGVRALVVLPLREAGIVRGVLAVGADEAGAFQAAEARVLTGAATDVSFALDVLAGEARRKEAEAALRRNEERMSFLLGATPGMVYSLSNDGRPTTIYISENVREVLGYAPESFAADPRFWIDRVHPDDAAAAVAGMPELGRTRRVLREYRFRHADGSYRWMRDECRLVRSGPDDAEVIVGYWLDVTRERGVEAESRKHARAIEQAPLSIVITGLDGAIEYANPEFSAVTGYTLEEVRGKNPRVLKSGRTPPERYAEMWRTLVAGGVWRGELTNRKKNGELYTELAVVAPVTDGAGHVTHYVALKEDITARKQFETELHDLVKVLRAFHAVSVTVEHGRADGLELLEQIAGHLPPAMRQAGRARAEIRINGWEAVAGAAGPAASWMAVAVTVNGRKAGELRLCYTEDPEVSPEPWTVRERELLESVARSIGLVLGRRESWEQLRRSEERFRAIFDQAEVGMFETDPEGKIARANRRFGELLGGEPAEWVGRNWRTVLREPVPAAGLPPEEPAEVRCRRSDGAEFHGQVVGRPERDAAGDVVGAICLLQDISTQVEARETLVRFNTELERQVAQRTAELDGRTREIQALLQANPDMVLRLRTDGTVLHYQPAHGSGRLAGIEHRLAPAEQTALRGTAIREGLELGRRALAEGGTATKETELPLGESRCPVELRAAPTGAEDFVVFVRDITDRKRIEAETAAMLQREREISEMKTRFISMASHEFRTPMAAAVGSAELMAHHYERLTPAKRSELLGRIKTSMGRMTEMLDDVLTLSRMDSKRTDVRRVALDVPPFLAAILDEVRVGNSGGHAFELKVPETTEAFPMDPNLLRHICSNLVGNAVRFSPPGSPVTVELGFGAEGMTLAVSDRGIGVPEADRGRIFEPFERGSNVGTIKGTGLGLNIVKRMTDLLGGRIRVDGVEGGGTRFTLTFPRAAEASGAT